MNFNSIKAESKKGAGIRGSFLTQTNGPVHQATRVTATDLQPLNLLNSQDNNSGIYESTDFSEGIAERRATAGPNKFAKSKKNELYDSMESNVKVRKGSVLKPMTNTKENDKACCKDGGCIIF